MTDPDREQLRRDCSDALEALHRDGDMEHIPRLAESLRFLGPPYRFHGELMHKAFREDDENAITWHLIHVLEGARRVRREGVMARKKAAKKAKRKASRRKAVPKKKPTKAKPRKTRPANKPLLDGGIYAGDPTGGHIAGTSAGQ